jgi:biopolymer transport protein ExbB
VNSPTSYRRLLLAWGAALLLLACPCRVVAQDANAPAPAAATAPADTGAPAAGAPGAPGTTKTLWQQIVEGGWVMFPIAACSIAMIYFTADGIFRTRGSRLAPAEHEAQLKALFQAGDYVGAYRFCQGNSSPLTNVVRTGVSLMGEGKQAAEEGMTSELAKENSRIQTWISYLSVIGVCSPMIGLLGTVTGMIRAFSTLGSSGIGDPSSLSSAIGEVLTATASGLFIAIPAFIAFYFLRNRAISGMHHIQDVVASLFRKMPYEHVAGVHVGDDIIFAAMPNWISTNQAVSAQ